ncbi:MAG: serine hydrolase domain-containing protein [Spirosomataceae bacterium]
MKKLIKNLGAAALGLVLILSSCEKITETTPVQTNCSVENKRHPKAAKYQQIADKFLKAGTVGVSITIRTPEGVWSSASGKADLKNNIDLSPCHTLRIGSISKTFASATILKLQEEGKLNINDLASKYLPEEFQGIANLDKATVRNLLQHTSGVPEYLGIKGILDLTNGTYKKRSAAESMRIVLKSKAQFEVGKDWSYANSNFLLLALIIENVAKKPAYEVVTEKIIKPLGLKNTLASTAIPSNLSRGYYDFMNNGLMKDQTDIDNNAVGGQDMLDGGMISNPNDLALFMEALNTSKFLSEKSLIEMRKLSGFTGKAPAGFEFIYDYGLGLFLIDVDGKKGFGHGGNVQCFNGLAYYFPEQKISISILVNSYSKKIADVLYDVETLKMVL